MSVENRNPEFLKMLRLEEIEWRYASDGHPEVVRIRRGLESLCNECSSHQIYEVVEMMSSPYANRFGWLIEGVPLFWGSIKCSKCWHSSSSWNVLIYGLKSPPHPILFKKEGEDSETETWEAIIPRTKHNPDCLDP